MFAVYTKGPKSRVTDEYIAIVRGDTLIWCYPNRPSVMSNLSESSKAHYIEEWLTAEEWKKVKIPKHTKVALRLCDPKDAYEIAMEGAKQMAGKQGFASMDRTRQREIASKGGRMAHLMKRGHEWTAEEAREAGRKGGAASKAKQARNKELIANMGEHVEAEQA